MSIVAKVEKSNDVAEQEKSSYLNFGKLGVKAQNQPLIPTN